MVVDETLPIHLDFSKLKDIDAKVLGDIFLLLQHRRNKGKELWFDPVPLKVRRLFSYYGVEYLLEDKATAVAVGQDGNKIF